MKRRPFSQVMLYAMKGVNGEKEKGDIVWSSGRGGGEDGKMIQNFAKQHNNTQYCADVQFMLYTSGSRLKFLLTLELLFCNKIKKKQRSK